MGQCNFLHLWHQKLYRAFRFGTLWPISCSYPRHSQLTRHSLMLANGRIRQSLTALVTMILQFHFLHGEIFVVKLYQGWVKHTKCLLGVYLAINRKEIDHTYSTEELMFVSLWHVSAVNVGVTYSLFHWTINMNNREMITDVSLYQTLEGIMYVRKQFVNMLSIKVALFPLTLVGRYIRETNESECRASTKSVVSLCLP